MTYSTNMLGMKNTQEHLVFIALSYFRSAVNVLQPMCMNQWSQTSMEGHVYAEFSQCIQSEMCYFVLSK